MNSLMCASRSGGTFAGVRWLRPMLHLFMSAHCTSYTAAHSRALSAAAYAQHFKECESCTRPCWCLLLLCSHQPHVQGSWQPRCVAERCHSQRGLIKILSGNGAPLASMRPWHQQAMAHCLKTTFLLLIRKPGVLTWVAVLKVLLLDDTSADCFD